MNQPPKTRLEFWVRFVCASIVFGFAGGFGVLRLLDELPLTILLIGWLVSTFSATLIAVRYGDSVWSQLIKWFTCCSYLLGLRGP